ncbi:hypothetical protein [Streptomyces johnsoniae]|uniref:Uncharacterized protein n=1 Tax=Streptomyces johnsoniae TaxID=3075532 RepID=A0ABU2S3W1_9ACTN|nr:hypothetical protein [Streptomyces sp. DSM 41886]MDT0442305.1 hypothetical protein [Streptomyces sp. DSM 41886]
MRYFYYEPADYTACEQHMATQLGEWFPETAENCKGPMWNYHGWDLDELVAALMETGEMLSTHFCELAALGPDADNERCQSLH